MKTFYCNSDMESSVISDRFLLLVEIEVEQSAIRTNRHYSNFNWSIHK